MIVNSADELQALLQYHAQSIDEAIEENGLKPSQHPILIKTIQRMLHIAHQLSKCKVKA